jgi:hypothetical protein
MEKIKDAYLTWVTRAAMAATEPAPLASATTAARAADTVWIKHSEHTIATTRERTNAEDDGKQCGDRSNVSSPQDGLEGAALEALRIGEGRFEVARQFLGERSEFVDAEIVGCERS